MPNFREIKRKARRVLHQHMQVPAVYVAPNGTATPLHVRDHTKFGTVAPEGAVRSGNGQMVERNEMIPSMIVMLDEVPEGLKLIRNGVIVFSASEAYTLNNAEAPDDITVKWNLTRITDAAKLATFLTPEDFA